MTVPSKKVVSLVEQAARLFAKEVAGQVAHEAESECRSCGHRPGLVSWPLSIKTSCGVHRVIEKGARLPAFATETFTTAEDNQSAVDIKLVEDHQSGRREVLKLRLPTVLSPAKTPIVEVSIRIDVDGTAHVTATEVKTGRTVTGSVVLAAVPKKAAPKKAAPKKAAPKKAAPKKAAVPKKAARRKR